ncbi:terminase [Oligella urethralis]|uniref:terminase large subunit n=1 Tax=Oligella urethralis TaxID=90245 RepID=UPI000D00BEC7|nr:terminase large subunit [Oligella urethralis]AVL70859.1 terminase [Oligella urethralis]
MEWTTACPDWERRIVAGESLIPFDPLFPDEAAQAVEIFGSLRMVDAPDSPLMRDTCEKWVMDLVGAIFGAYNHSTGRRLVRELFLLISKKNGKSTIAAGIMLTALIMNWRQSAELLILSPTKEIADNSFKPIRDMIAIDDDLRALFQVQEHIRTITHRVTKAFLKVVAADSETVSGKKAVYVFVDELHEFGKKPRAGNMLLEATGGLASRPEGFVIYATTQSESPPAGVFKEKLDYARAVRDGRIEDNAFLPVLYEFPKSMIDSGEHRNLENAYITNPNWGVSVDIEHITREFNKATEAGEEQLRVFLAKHLNVEIGLALLSNRWAGADFWEAQAGAHNLDELIERSEVITAGIDGGGLDDLLGFAVLGRDKHTKQWLLWNRAWAHPSVLSRHKQDVSRLEDFKRADELVFVNRMGEDTHELAELCLKLYNSGKLNLIGVDPSGTGSILESIDKAGIPADKLMGVSQGWRLNGAIITAERKLAAGELVHANQALMAWCVGNAKVEPRGNAILITKQASGSGKIDPLMATLNAVSLMALNPEGQGDMDTYLEQMII